MHQVVIGDLLLQYDGRRLTVRARETNVLLLYLEETEIWQFDTFLQSLNPVNPLLRDGFRIPVLPASGLFVNLDVERASFSVKPRNISLNGILTAFSGDDIPDIAPGTPVRVRLRLRFDTATLSGIVARRRENLYGIAFRGQEGDDDPEPPVSLVQIVNRLEKHWLRTRAQE